MKTSPKFMIQLFLMLFVSFGFQTGNNFTIYVRKNVYNIEDYFNQHKVFQYYSLLGKNFIDPKNTDEINVESISKRLNTLYPEKNSTGTLFLDMENKYFENLKSYFPGTTQYDSSVQAFKKLISTVRSNRPNIKIGIYGLPFRTYYDGQSKWNSGNKLDPILSLCDVITPSLYTLFPNKEKGPESNKNYMQKNLQTALDYGKRLNKPVIPFIWYVVSPGNKQYGGEILEQGELVNQIKFIQNFLYQNTKAQGVIWWESSDKAFTTTIKLPETVKANSNIIKDKNSIIREYTKSFVQ